MENEEVICLKEEEFEDEFYSLIDNNVYALLLDKDIDALKGNARTFEVLLANTKYAQLWKSVSESFIETERKHQ